MKTVKVSCRKCARFWLATPQSIQAHPQCPYCGAKRIHVQ